MCRRSVWMIFTALILVIGCSQAARNRLERFFFEVPQETKSASGSQATPTLATYEPPRLPPPPSHFTSVHPPFRKRQCTQCHDPTAERENRLRDNITNACQGCHVRFFSQEVGHQPVIDRQCLTCHFPHRSIQRALLRQPILETCTDCHDDPEDLSEEAHGREGVERCTGCHDPHFGQPPMLKSGRSPTVQQSPPAAQPPAS